MKYLILFLSLFLGYTEYSFAQEPLWTQTVTVDTGYSIAEATDIVVDKSGNTYTLCNFRTDHSFYIGADTVSSNSFAIVKIDKNGKYVWVKNMVSSPINNLPFNLSIDLQGNIYAAGTFHSAFIALDGDTLVNTKGTLMQANYFIYKIDSNGKVIYGKNGGECYSLYMYSPIINDEQGNLYFLGNFNSNNIVFGSDTLINTSGKAQLFFVKFDPNGNPIWAKTITGDAEIYQGAITIDPFGDILIAGTTTSRNLAFGPKTINNIYDYGVYLAKYNTKGDVVWANIVVGNNGSKPYGPPYMYLVSSITTDHKGDIFMTGGFMIDLYISSKHYLARYIPSPLGNTDGYVAKFTKTGEPIWSFSFGKDEADFGWEVAINPNNGNLLLTGGFNSAAIKINEDYFNNPDVLEQDAGFLAEIDTMGNVVCKAIFNGGGDDWLAVAVDNDGYMYLGGDYWVHKFIIGSDTFSNPGGAEKFFVTKIAPCPGTINSVKKNVEIKDIKVFPNPVLDYLTIEVEGKTGYRILSVIGKCLQEGVLLSKNNIIDVRSISNGICILETTNSKGERNIFRIIKE